MYKIKVKTGVAKQGNKTITKYTNIFKNLWQELDHYQCIKKKCREDATILKNYIEKGQVYDFLISLNAEFDQLRVQILSQEPPTLNKTISII